MEKNKIEAMQIFIPKNAEEYFQKNASRLLEAPDEMLKETVDGLLGLPKDEKQLALYLETIRNHLKTLADEKLPERGIMGVIEGGKSEKKMEIPFLHEGPIQAIYDDIRIFTEIPNEEARIDFVNNSQEKVTIRPLCDFILDTERVVVGYIQNTGQVAYFKLTEAEDKVRLDLIQDKDRVKTITTLWNAIKEVFDIEGYEQNFYA